MEHLPFESWEFIFAIEMLLYSTEHIYITYSRNYCKSHGIIENYSTAFNQSDLGRQQCWGINYTYNIYNILSLHLNRTALEYIYVFYLEV